MSEKGVFVVWLSLSMTFKFTMSPTNSHMSFSTFNSILHLIYKIQNIKNNVVGSRIATLFEETLTHSKQNIIGNIIASICSKIYNISPNKRRIIISASSSI